MGIDQKRLENKRTDRLPAKYASLSKLIAISLRNPYQYTTTGDDKHQNSTIQISRSMKGGRHRRIQDQLEDMGSGED